MPARVSWALPDGRELEISALPERKNFYVLLHDRHGLRSLARLLGDEESEVLARVLDDLTAPTKEMEEEPSGPGKGTGRPAAQ